MHIRTITAMSDDEIDKEASTIRQQGAAWLFQHIGHTAGIYGFFARVAQATRMEADHKLCWWETGRVCERRYLVGEQWYNFRPDRMGLRDDERARPRHQVCLLWALPCLAGVGKRVLTDPSACVCGTRYRTGEAYIACSSSQTRACSWI
jgi:hypothetical protein